MLSAMINYDCTIGPAPDFINVWNEIEGDINIVIAKVTCAPSNNEVVLHNDQSPTKTEINTDAEDLDVTGSPLKCPFDLHDKLSTQSSEESVAPVQHQYPFLPVTAMEARGILSDLCTDNKCPLKNDIPTWVLVDGSDELRTALLGCHREGEWLSRWVVSGDGIINSSACKQRHEQFLTEHSTRAGSIKFDARISAIYSLYSGDDVNKGSMHIHFQWKNYKTVMEPPPLDAEAVLNLVIAPGDPRSPVHSLWQELKLVSSYISLLNDLEEGKTGTSWPTQVNRKGISPMEELKKLIEGGFQSKSSAFKNHLESPDSVVNEYLMENTGVQYRNNFDFVEHLWMILCGCENFNELEMAFRHLCRDIQNGEVKPHMFSRSPALLSQMIQELLQGTSLGHHLVGKDALYALVDAGLEKIHKDYMHYYLAAELTTLDDMAGWSPKASLHDRFSWLNSKYLALQVVTTCSTFLGANQKQLQHIARMALSQYEMGETAFCETYTFSTNIESKSLVPVVSRMSPKLWQLNLMSRKYEQKIETILVFSHKPLFPFLTLTEDAELESGKEDSFLFLSTMRKTSSKI